METQAKGSYEEYRCVLVVSADSAIPSDESSALTRPDLHLRIEACLSLTTQQQQQATQRSVRNSSQWSELRDEVEWNNECSGRRRSRR